MIVQVTRRLRKKRIVILGGGFGGVYAAIHLEKLLAHQSAVEISLVSRDNFFLFTPMLHEIAASDLEITNIVNPLRKLLHKVEVPFSCALKSFGIWKKQIPNAMPPIGSRYLLS